jgi:hypothetical protein
MKCSMMGPENDDLDKTGDCLIEVTLKIKRYLS